MASRALADFDRLVGRNLRALRRAAKISQSDLAAGMTRRGAAISQPIFTRIERGERPLKFQEAMAAADVLGLTVTDLLHPPAPASDQLRAAHYLGELQAGARLLDQDPLPGIAEAS